ncbi:hypothetical protein VL06_10610 [Rossellomorea marisflavi]|nr:hypothetical protein VL06_10610 [Rossellomorea marisflavi]
MMKEEKAIRQGDQEPSYYIENGETIFLKSQLHLLKLEIARLSRGALFAEAAFYKKRLSEVQSQWETSQEEIEAQQAIEEDLIRDRNHYFHKSEENAMESRNLREQLLTTESSLQEWKEKSFTLLAEVNALKEKNAHLILALSEREQEASALSDENDTLKEWYDRIKTDALKKDEKLLNQQAHIDDLRNALAHSEDSKNALFTSLLMKTEQFEELVSERTIALSTLQQAKERLKEAEIEKMTIIKEMMLGIQQEMKDYEWLMESRFGDIDQKRKEQEDRLDEMEALQLLGIQRQHVFMQELIEETDRRFFEEIQTIRSTNHSLSSQVQDLKTMIEHHRRRQVRPKYLGATKSES